MAGDWLKLNFGLWDHRCVRSVAHTLALDVDTVVGKLARLWAWAQTQTMNGKVTPCSTMIVDQVARLDGFSDALRKAGWLEIGEDYVVFVRWGDHNSDGAKRRAQTAKRVSRSRNARVTLALRSQRNKSAPREEQEQEQEQSRARQREEIEIKAKQGGANHEAEASPLRLASQGHADTPCCTNAGASGLSGGSESKTQQRGDKRECEQSPLRSALLGVGLTMTEADVVLWHPKYDEQAVRRAIAEMADMRARGRPAKNPKRFLLTQAGMEQSAKSKHASAVRRVMADAARLREGAKG